MAYGRWSRHVNNYQNENDSQDQVLDGNVEAEKRPQPKKRAENKEESRAKESYEESGNKRTEEDGEKFRGKTATHR